MKIAFVNNKYQLGGAETVVQQLYSGCRSAGHDCRLYVAEGKTYPEFVTPFYPKALSYLSHTRLAGTVERLFPRNRWTDRRFQALASSDADLIHVHNFHGLYARIESLAELSHRKPVVWTFHRFWGITGGCDHPKHCERYQQTCGDCPLLGEWPLGKEDTTAEQLALKLKHFRGAPMHIVAPSQHLQRRVTESRVGALWPVTYIPNGVDPGQFGYKRKRDPQFRRSLNVDETAITVLITNRDFRDPIKGFQYIAEALEAIDPAGLELLLVGNNSAWALQKLVRFRCRDFGYVRDRRRMAELYEVADIYLYASQAENFPCAILEAMSSRCCIVSTPTDGVLEQVEDGISGHFSERIDGASLGSCLARVIARFSPENPWGRSARERVEAHFSEADMIARHLRLYGELVGGGSG